MAQTVARSTVAVAVLVLQIVAQASSNPVPTCRERSGPERMVVVAAPTPYYSWEQCSQIYPTEPINETKHAGVVTVL